MKFLFLFCSFLFSASAFAQNTITYLDENGKPVTDKALAKTYTETITADSTTATIRTYTIDGKIQSEHHYSNLRKNQVDGISKDWFESGQLKLERTFKQGKLNGPLKSFYANGKLKRSDLYKENELVEGKCFTRTGADTAHYAFLVTPQYPGGDEMLMKFLSSNIRYPKKALKSKTEGLVVLQFQVDKDGKAKEPVIVKPVSPELDEETIRVFSMLPDFTPARQDGELIRMKYYLPVRFSIK